MSRLSVEEILKAVSSTVNQEAASPLVNTAEYNLWIAYLNRGLDEWGNAHDWEELRKFHTFGSTQASGATVALPQNFRKLASPPKVGGQYVEEVNDETAIRKTPQEKYLRVIGNPASGFSLLFNPATLASGARVDMEYYSFPSSLSGFSDYSEMADPQFLIDRTVAYIFESRSDARFQIAETKARERLLTMVEAAEERKYNSLAGDSALTTPESRMGFRLGRD